jgi:hypothetical protein
MVKLARAFCNMLSVTNGDRELRCAGVEEFIPQIAGTKQYTDDLRVVLFTDESVFIQCGDKMSDWDTLEDMVESAASLKLPGFDLLRADLAEALNG